MVFFDFGKDMKESCDNIDYRTCDVVVVKVVHCVWAVMYSKLNSCTPYDNQPHQYIFKIFFNGMIPLSLKAICTKTQDRMFATLWFSS
jgi:hypothetical protein